MNASDTYRVTAYREYGIAQTGYRVVGYYRWYWQANIVSWMYFHILGMSCNTWKKS